MQIDGITAFVTGAGSGLGEASARMLAARGARVTLFDLPDSRGAEVALAIGAAARFSPGDVTDEAQVSAALDACRSSQGPIRALVHCAGIGTAGRTVDKHGAPCPLDVFRRTVEVNLVGSFNVIRLTAARMLNNPASAEGERGALVATASISAFDGQIGQAAYAASKGGVVGMTLPIARDLARHGIRVCAIAPGPFRTPLLEGLPQPSIDALEATIPFPPRLGRPSEFAALACHILENPMLNGETIRLDGALRMGPK
jgi:NAD(P)-dependent dehydrogenase (short-subunit alcohol dehydrogenase family)